MVRVFALAFLALYAPLEGGGVMYSAKQIYLGGRGRVWRNPYITDGLVAMWDGEWNAGGGVHDASKRVVDLSGNSSDLTLSADCTIGDNYFALAPGSSESRIGGTVSIPELAGQSLLEFRIVARFTETTSWNKHCFYSSENTLYEFNYAHRNSTQIVPGVLLNGNLAFVSNLSQYGGTVFALESQCRQVNYDGRNSYAAWLDNVYTTIGVTGSFRQSSDTSTDLHILKMATSNVDQTGYIYSFAIYNRYLTDAERAANYAIDKARFNLP